MLAEELGVQHGTTATSYAGPILVLQAGQVRTAPDLAMLFIALITNIMPAGAPAHATPMIKSPPALM